jgi:hypothetical protein
MAWFLILPGLLAAYFLFFRSILKAIPALKGFYAEADGFWAKVWAVCGKSVTMVWGYFLAAIGALSSALGDPSIMAQITGALKEHPEYLGYVLMGVSAVTIATRLRSIGKG